MASVNFLLQGKKNPSNIYCRFTHTRAIDIFVKTNVFINPQYWNKDRQKIKNVLAVKNRDSINKKLLQLKIDLIDNFNVDYTEGKIIDKFWLKENITSFFGRPKNEKSNTNQNHTIYLSDFADWWLENKAPTWLTSATSYMSKDMKSQYRTFLKQVKEYQGKTKLKLNETGYQAVTDYVIWLNENGYSEKTIKRKIGRFKFFLNRAKQEGFAIDPTYEQRVFIPKSEEILEPVLDIGEIETIYNLKIKNEPLNNAKDNLIIACWTGLRISDFNNKLDISNFIDDFIEIRTTKTKTPVVIPVHPMVKRILIKHKGKLPKKVSDNNFNKQIKKVCEIAGINEIMKGRIYDKNKKRKVAGFFEKYKLVTSHIGRRSFATNLFGEIELHIISAILGHSTTKQTLEYIKRGNKEHAKKLKEYWDKQHKTI